MNIALLWIETAVLSSQHSRDGRGKLSANTLCKAILSAREDFPVRLSPMIPMTIFLSFMICHAAPIGVRAQGRTALRFARLCVILLSEAFQQA